MITEDQPTLQNTDINNLASRYQHIRDFTERLCNPLKPEDYVVQPVVDVSPPKWHLAHTSWFFETFVLERHLEGYETFHPDYCYLFNSYYETVGERVLRPMRGNMSRPGTEDIMAYRKHVDEGMLRFLETSFPEHVLDVIEIGLQHEQQHQELLLTDIKYILGHNPLFPVYRKPTERTGDETISQQWLEVNDGMYEIGFKGEGFHFDNETGRHRVFLHPYRLSNRLTTNGEFIEFIQDGGYSDFRHWLSDGWDWVNQQEVGAPLYWHEKGGVWHHYTLGGFKEVDPKQPVTHVSYYEADAFARWSGKRLLTEFEWEVACHTFEEDLPARANFVELGYFHPQAAFPQNRQLYGDCWEWTQSAYLPYPYFKPNPGALGEYNGKFMVNQMVLRGGSCATSASHIRSTYRNFFHAPLRWQFTGIRVAESI